MVVNQVRGAMCRTAHLQGLSLHNFLMAVNVIISHSTVHLAHPPTTPPTLGTHLSLIETFTGNPPRKNNKRATMRRPGFEHVGVVLTSVLLLVVVLSLPSNCDAVVGVFFPSFGASGNDTLNTEAPLDTLVPEHPTIDSLAPTPGPPNSTSTQPVENDEEPSNTNDTFTSYKDPGSVHENEKQTSNATSTNPSKKEHRRTGQPTQESSHVPTAGPNRISSTNRPIQPITDTDIPSKTPETKAEIVGQRPSISPKSRNRHTLDPTAHQEATTAEPSQSPKKISAAKDHHLSTIPSSVARGGDGDKILPTEAPHESKSSPKNGEVPSLDPTWSPVTKPTKIPAAKTESENLSQGPSLSPKARNRITLDPTGHLVSKTTEPSQSPKEISLAKDHLSFKPSTVDRDRDGNGEKINPTEAPQELKSSPKNGKGRSPDPTWSPTLESGHARQKPKERTREKDLLSDWPSDQPSDLPSVPPLSDPPFSNESGAGGKTGVKAPLAPKPNTQVQKPTIQVSSDPSHTPIEESSEPSSVPTAVPKQKSHRKSGEPSPSESGGHREKISFAEHPESTSPSPTIRHVIWVTDPTVSPVAKSQDHSKQTSTKVKKPSKRQSGHENTTTTEPHDSSISPVGSEEDSMGPTASPKFDSRQPSTVTKKPTKSQSGNEITSTTDAPEVTNAPVGSEVHLMEPTTSPRLDSRQPSTETKKPTNRQSNDKSSTSTETNEDTASPVVSNVDSTEPTESPRDHSKRPSAGTDKSSSQRNGKVPAAKSPVPTVSPTESSIDSLGPTTSPSLTPNEQSRGFNSKGGSTKKPEEKNSPTIDQDSENSGETNKNTTSGRDPGTESPDTTPPLDTTAPLDSLAPTEGTSAPPSKAPATAGDSNEKLLTTTPNESDPGTESPDTTPPLDTTAPLDSFAPTERTNAQPSKAPAMAVDIRTPTSEPQDQPSKESFGGTGTGSISHGFGTTSPVETSAPDETSPPLDTKAPKEVWRGPLFSSGGEDVPFKTRIPSETPSQAPIAVSKPTSPISTHPTREPATDDSPSRPIHDQTNSPNRKPTRKPKTQKSPSALAPTPSILNGENSDGENNATIVPGTETSTNGTATNRKRRHSPSTSPSYPPTLKPTRRKRKHRSPDGSRGSTSPTPPSGTWTPTLTNGPTAGAKKGREYLGPSASLPSNMTSTMNSTVVPNSTVAATGPPTTRPSLRGGTPTSDAPSQVPSTEGPLLESSVPTVINSGGAPQVATPVPESSPPSSLPTQSRGPTEIANPSPVPDRTTVPPPTAAPNNNNAATRTSAGVIAWPLRNGASAILLGALLGHLLLR